MLCVPDTEWQAVLGFPFPPSAELMGHFPTQVLRNRKKLWSTARSYVGMADMLPQAFPGSLAKPFHTLLTRDFGTLRINANHLAEPLKTGFITLSV